MSARDKILAAASAFKPKAVEIPELGGTIYIRPLTLGGLSRFQQIVTKDVMRGSAQMLIECICDENGKPEFTAADEAAIMDWPQHLAAKLVDIASEISALTKPKAGEDAAGN